MILARVLYYALVPVPNVEVLSPDTYTYVQTHAQW